MNPTNHFRKRVLFGFFLVMTLFRAIVIYNMHGVDCKSLWLAPIFPCRWEDGLPELILWVMVLLLLAFELFWDRDFHGFFSACKAHWPIFAFVLFAALSVIWSVLPLITLYKVFILFSTSIVAIYMGYKRKNARLLEIFTVFFSVICIANLAVVFLFPQISRWGGLTIWNGIFWHKIYLGAFSAFTIAVFLLRLLDWKKLDKTSKISIPFILLAAVVLLVNSSSVAGYINAGILAAVCLLIAAWIRWQKNLKPVHYYIFSGITILAFSLILANLDFIFGLFGRNTSLTGRIPMWTYLFEDVISKRPILGYGYNAIWNLQGFREQMTLDMNFSLQVSQSDNGFMEIILHLGILGLVLLVGLMIIGLVRSIKYLRQERTLTSALPLVILVFLILVNTTVSMLLETDTFVWAIFVASQVAIKFQKQELQEAEKLCKT